MPLMSNKFFVHYSSNFVSKSFKIFDAFWEILGDLVNWLYGLISIGLSAVPFCIHLLEASLPAEHILYHNLNTWIYPIELAIPAPYPRRPSPYWQTPNSMVNQYSVPSWAITSSEAPSDNSPIFCDKALVNESYTATSGSASMAMCPMTSWMMSG